MVAFKLEDFSGIMPRYSARLLPPNAAVTAEENKPLEGEIRGFHQPNLLTDLSSLGFTVGRAYRIPASVPGSSDVWLGFQDPNTDIVRSPVLNDVYNRYYWASASVGPKYNTLARIVAGNTGGNAPWDLGVTQPSASPTVTPPAGSTETRSYVYTFVTAYGEEGPPSNPTTATGTTGTWALSAMSTSGWSGSRNITKQNIYRTVPGSTGFFFVAQQNLASTYSDTSLDTDIALNNVLQFVDNFPPDANLQGFALMPQGY